MSDENVLSANSKSKRHPKIEVGQRFGMLVTVADLGTDDRGNRHWLCDCDCGTKSKRISQCSLRLGQDNCRCLGNERIRKARTKHGHNARGRIRPEYKIWVEMIRRCHVKTSNRYREYGARGISVCDRWRGENGYLNFITDVGDRPSKRHSLGRIDNNKGYCKENCRWETQREQMNNTRSNVHISFRGETMTQTQWERKLGFTHGTLHRRLKSGWSIEKTMTTPSKRNANASS